MSLQIIFDCVLFVLSTGEKKKRFFHFPGNKGRFSLKCMDICSNWKIIVCKYSHFHRTKCTLLQKRVLSWSAFPCVLKLCNGHVTNVTDLLLFMACWSKDNSIYTRILNLLEIVYSISCDFILKLFFETHV